MRTKALHIHVLLPHFVQCFRFRYVNGAGRDQNSWARKQVIEQRRVSIAAEEDRVRGSG